MPGDKQVGLTFGEGTPEWQHIQRTLRKKEFLKPATLCRTYLNQRIRLAEVGLDLKMEEEIGIRETVIREKKFFQLVRELSGLPSTERKKKIDGMLKSLGR